MRFDELNLNEAVLEGLDAMNFQEMTPVQELSIPPILEGKDVIACAQTGTGKTAAYVLPVISNLSGGTYPTDAINAIIMAPTRELAQQIDQQIEGFSYYVNVSAVAVYGGTDGIVYAQQERGMQMGADIVIATPGRLIAHLNLGGIDLSRVSFFILDEADRMLDMGFYEDIIQIYKLLPQSCQIIMFSATMPPKIKTLAENIMKSPVEVEIAIAKPPESIMQTAYICYENQKLRILEKQFRDTPPKRVIIFSSSKQKVKTLTATLKRMNINVAEMHSDLEQSTRELVMRDFKNGHIDVLVATDVVSRGIDINDISLIINYDIPKDPEDYVHRIGRTARGTDGKGLSITLVSEQEQYGFKVIETFLGKAIYKIPLDPEFGATPTYDPDKKRDYRNDGNARTGRTGGRPPGRPSGRRDTSNSQPRPNRGKPAPTAAEYKPPTENAAPTAETNPATSPTPAVTDPAPVTNQRNDRPQQPNQRREGQKPQGDRPDRQQGDRRPRREGQKPPSDRSNRQPRDQKPQDDRSDRQSGDQKPPSDRPRQPQGAPRNQGDRNGQQPGNQSRRRGNRSRRNANGERRPQKPGIEVPDRYQNRQDENAAKRNSAADTNQKHKWWEFWKT